MMGHQSDSQDQLFYSFNLEAYVPPNHLLRGIHQFLDLSDLRQHLIPFYSHTGTRYPATFGSINSCMIVSRTVIFSGL
jgi:hypothetical protein